MRDFNKLRKMWSGGIFDPSSAAILEEALRGPLTTGGVVPQANPGASVTTVATGNTGTPEKTGWQKFTGAFSTAGKDIWGSMKSGGTAYRMLQQGLGMTNAFVNRGLENGKGYDTANNIMSGVASTVGKFNPLIGLAISGVQTGLNVANRLGAETTDNYSIDTETQAQMGNSYTGSYEDMASAQSKAGKKYGLFNRHNYKKAQDEISKAKRLDDQIQGINEDNQTRLAMAANTYNNNINYTNKLNGGIDFNNLVIGRSGFKIKHIQRVKNIKRRINVDTKQIEEFNDEPVFTPVISEFKEGGVFTPIISEPFIPIITDPVESFKEGGKTEEKEELVVLEETNQKNIIPDGALHKNKHHMEHTDGLTQKGIPVIDNNGEQQAEIELNEIIFTLEVTKKLEQLHKIYKEGSNEERDKAAIEAGKLLVQEILYNTDDRTGLIAKCEKGGKLE